APGWDCAVPTCLFREIAKGGACRACAAFFRAPPAMKTINRFLFWAAALAAAGVTSVRAAEPAPNPETGRVLVLHNECTLEGDIDRVGDRYRIRRPVGETCVPAAAVLRLCADLDEAYQFLRGRTNLTDADEHLRL